MTPDEFISWVGLCVGLFAGYQAGVVRGILLERRRRTKDT